MSASIADGVLAATHRLVQQTMSGQWSEVPKTLEERRALLEQLGASAAARDQPWLHALRQAMAESDAVVAAMTRSAGTSPGPALSPVAAASVSSASPQAATSAVDSVMDMIQGSNG